MHPSSESPTPTAFGEGDRRTNGTGRQWPRPANFRRRGRAPPLHRERQISRTRPSRPSRGGRGLPTRPARALRRLRRPRWARSPDEGRNRWKTKPNMQDPSRSTPPPRPITPSPNSNSTAGIRSRTNPIRGRCLRPTPSPPQSPTSSTPLSRRSVTPVSSPISKSCSGGPSISSIAPPAGWTAISTTTSRRSAGCSGNRTAAR